MKTSAAGRAAISRREANKLKAYKDSVGVLTIGVGHTSAAGEPKVTPGMTITAAQSDEILSRDLQKFENAVNSVVKVPLSQSQFDALVSLAFNIGGGAFSKSTLVRKLNKGDYAGAADAFLTWNRAGGKVLPGLTTRRQSERKQFLQTKASTKAVGLSVDGTMVAVVQAKLASLGYNPGGVDGKMGPLTRGAVLAFKNDHGLPVNDTVDASLLSALDTAKPREMVAARANATSTEVSAKIPEAGAHWWNKWGAAAAGIPAAAAGAADYIAPARGYIDQVRDMFADVPSYVWFIGVALLCSLLFWNARRGQQASVEAFRQGDRR